MMVVMKMGIGNGVRGMLAASLAVGACLVPASVIAADGKLPVLNGFKSAKENGVTVWRARAVPKPVVIPALEGAPQKVVTKTIVERVVVKEPRFTPAKVRVVGHYSGYGKRIPFVQGFYSGYPRSKNSRSYVQGFYSGYKRNQRRRFPTERPDGYRRFRR